VSAREASSAVAVVARGLDDNVQMFALDSDQLTRTDFLDVASGASAFGAELRDRGGWALSCDPLYAQGLQAVAERAANGHRSDRGDPRRRRLCITDPFGVCSEYIVRTEVNG
jgi:hypothetical protein